MTTTTIHNGTVIEYPKIHTLYLRDEVTRKVKTDSIRHPEFEAVSRWHVTEKIDGTNVRVALMPDGTVFYGGRTDNAQMPPKLLNHLMTVLPTDKLREQFPLATEPVVLFGEGYGPGIQSGGVYRKDISFRLFDVRIGRWLKQEVITTIASSLGVGRVPILEASCGLARAISLVNSYSTVSIVEDGKYCHMHEGIIARSEPLMLDREGRRIMWKLKRSDF